MNVRSILFLYGAVRDVRYAGHVVAGIIDATTHPKFVSGTGSILSPAKGTMFSVR